MNQAGMMRAWRRRLYAPLIPFPFSHTCPSYASAITRPNLGNVNVLYFRSFPYIRLNKEYEISLFRSKVSLRTGPTANKELSCSLLAPFGRVR